MSLPFLPVGPAAPPNESPSGDIDRAARRAGRVATATAVFVACICAALAGLAILMVVRARDADLRQADIASANLARAVAQQMDATFSEVEHVLDSLVYELERKDADADTFVQLQPLLVIQASSVPQIHDLFAYDENGRWQASSNPNVDPEGNNSDREYFTFHRDSPSRRMHIGAPIVSRTTGVWIIPLSRRVDDADGRFAGVVMASIRIDYVLRLLSDFDIGRLGAIALFRESGEVLSRRPYVEQDLGKSIAASPLFALMRQAPTGGSVMRSPLDQVLRRVRYQRLANQPLQVTVALAEDEVLSDWSRTSIAQAVVVLALCTVIAGAGTLLVRAIRHRGRAEARLHFAQRELRDVNARLLHQSRHDGLTDLPNRRSFDEHLGLAVAQAARAGQPVAVVMMDVDHFKRYNDRYGHPAGDRCLQAVARAVMSAARRPGDVVARYGGEEMVALLPNTDRAGAWIVAEAMRQAVAELAVEHAENPPGGRVTISVGVAAQVPDRVDRDAAALLRDADAALYRAKAGGRDRVEVHDAES